MSAALPTPAYPPKVTLPWFLFQFLWRAWRSLISASSFHIVPLFYPCLLLPRFSGVPAAGGARTPGVWLALPWRPLGAPHGCEHLLGKKQPWSHQVTSVEPQGGNFSLIQNTGRIKSCNKKASGHLSALRRMACWYVTHGMWKNKRIKNPNSSAMRKHLSATGMFHQGKKEKI